MKNAIQPPAVILVVDDDPIMLMGVAAMLNTAGYEAHCARGEEAAIKAARSLPLDLIICDVNLAGHSGLELCRELRREPGIEEVPVMFMSALQVPDIVRRSHDAGGAYFLRKPFDPEVLIELVGKALWMPHLVQTHLNRLRETEMAPALEAPFVQTKPTIPAPNLAGFMPQGIPSVKANG